MKDTVLIRVNSSKKIGTGHLVRMLYLAKKLSKNKRAIFITNNNPEAINTFHNNGFNYEIIKSDSLPKDMQSNNPKHLNKELPFMEKLCLKYKPKAVILDIINTSKAYISMIKKYSKIVISFDDLSPDKKNIDLTINALWHKKSDLITKNVFCGHKYLLLRSEMYKNKHRLRKKIQNAFISFGGSDANNLTMESLKILKEMQNIKFHVVVGMNNPKKDIIKAYCKKHNMKFYFQVNRIDKIMQKCDIAISSGGITMYELLCKGVPTIIIRQIKNEFRYHTLPPGLVIDLGIGSLSIKNKLKKAFQALTDDPAKRMFIHNKLKREFTLKNHKMLLSKIERVIT